MALKFVAVLFLASCVLGASYYENIAEERDADIDRFYVDPILENSTVRNVYRVYDASSGVRAEERITSYPLTLHGGPVMATPTAYIIWYGTWTAAAKNIIQNFVTNVGTTAWWAINKPYGVGNLVFKTAISDNYSQGKTLTTSSIWAVVSNAITKGLVAKDPNGIYMVLSSSDVTQSGFCTSFCGWHTYGTISGVAYKFAWIGVPPTTCACYPQSTSPNGNSAVDAAVSVIAHELAEAATDPTGGGYCYAGTSTTCFSSGSVENGDQCAWYFPGSTTLNGYKYNLVVGSLKYYVQANWNLSKKSCLMA